MILIDTNILMYAGGSDHPNKAVVFLARVALGAVEATIDAESLQEMLWVAHRWKDGQRVFDLARRLMAAHPGLTARDAVHATAVQVYRLKASAPSIAILSASTAFTRITA